MIDAHPEFKKAKAFSDFIAFHVRIQFIFIIAFLVSAPVIVDMNAALRSGRSFESSAGVVDKVAIVVLIFSALWMSYLALKVIWRYVDILVAGRGDVGKAKRFVLLGWRALLFLVLASIDILVMAAVFWTGAERVSPLLGFRIGEVLSLLDQMALRGCVAGMSGCI